MSDDNVARTSISLAEERRTVYIAKYGDNYTGLAIMPGLRDDTGGATTKSGNSVSPPRDETILHKDMTAKRRRRIKNLALSNDFELFGILTFEKKKMRFDTKAQDEQIRKFCSKLKRKYPDFQCIAVRHKNKKGTGFHVHILISGLPRAAIRIKPGKFDRQHRQTYCLLGWRPNGWASVTYIDSLERAVNYISSTKQLSKLTKEERSLVTYTQNLTRAKRLKADLTEDSIEELKQNAAATLIYETECSLGDDIIQEKMQYKFCRGDVEIPAE